MDTTESHECQSFKEAQEMAKTLKKQKFQEGLTSYHVTIKRKQDGKFVVTMIVRK
jgi:hypothetical protein